tara:strand:+ start:1918 stop:2055 length:138 start_codon:yes stop_codon:yes gene_type:complete
MRGVALLKAIEESSRKRQQLATTIAAADRYIDPNCDRIRGKGEGN